MVSEHAEAVPGSRRREANSPDASCLCRTWEPRCGLESARHPIARAGQLHSGYRTVKKRMPTAERHRESITCRIGQYPTRKGADVAGWRVETTRRRALIQRKSSIPLWVNVTLEHRLYTVCNRRPGTFDELLELGAARVARPVLRGGGGSDITSLPNQLPDTFLTTHRRQRKHQELVNLHEEQSRAISVQAEMHSRHT